MATFPLLADQCRSVQETRECGGSHCAEPRHRQVAQRRVTNSKYRRRIRQEERPEAGDVRKRPVLTDADDIVIHDHAPRVDTIGSVHVVKKSSAVCGEAPVCSSQPVKPCVPHSALFRPNVGSRPEMEITVSSPRAYRDLIPTGSLPGSGVQRFL